jgi:hypothetical protein
MDIELSKHPQRIEAIVITPYTSRQSWNTEMKKPNAENFFLRRYQLLTAPRAN